VKPSVLFLCTHNAGRSQTAMGFVEHFAAGRADVVITMGCGDTCPVISGRRYEEWLLPDPAGQSVDAVRPIRDEIEQRVQGSWTSSESAQQLVRRRYRHWTWAWAAASDKR
jgi:arsenate reductase